MEFEQTQSIVTRIRQILEEYKYGDTVLLELLQNSDDAGASNVNIYLDDSGGSGAAPALYFHNDSVFSDRDLHNIQHIGGTEASSKRSDGTKVGRFGIGFNSAFHLADVVAFATGSNVVAFDPTKEHLPHCDGRPVGGLRWDYLTHKCRTPQEEQFLSGLLTAFEKCGEAAQLSFRRDAPFKGTLFRFQLRQAPSKLWREVHPAAEVKQLITEFRSCARLGMVLLKNVRSISVSCASAGLLYRVEAEGFVSGGVRDSVISWLAKYTAVMHRISEHANVNADDHHEGQLGQLPRPTTFTATVAVTVRGLGDAAAETTHFTVHHQLGPGDGWRGSACWKLAEEAARYHHPIAVPWSAAIVEDAKPCDGRLVCFFPIRRATGFPVHLHGYFELSSDRQSIKDSTISRWNSGMCSEVVPFAYCTAIAALAAARKPSYGLWPHGKFAEQSLATIAQRTTQLLAKVACIATQRGLETPEAAVFALPLSAGAHAIIAHGLTIASAPDPTDAEELQRLEAVRSTLVQHSVPHTTADPPIYREAVSRSSQKHLPAAIGEELLCKCTDDENYIAFLELADSLAVVPMHSGTTGRATPWNDGPEALLFAPDAATHELCAQFPFADRMVRSYHSADSVRGVTCRKRLEGLVAVGALAVLDEARVCAEIKGILSKHPVLRFDAEAGHHVLLPMAGESPAGSTSTSSDPKKPQGTAQQLLYPVSWALLVKFWQGCPASVLRQFAELPLLPAAAGAAAAPCREMYSVRRQVCVARDSELAAGDGAAAVQQVVRCLVDLGAHEVDSSLVPRDVLQRWKSDPRSVAVVGASSAVEVIAVIDALGKGQVESAKKALRAKLAEESIASVLLPFLLEGHSHLSVDDLSTWATLPLFPNIFGSRIALKGVKARGAATVYALPASLPEDVRAALQLLRPGEGALCGVDLVDPEMAFAGARVAASLFSVETISQLTARALALAVVSPPSAADAPTADEQQRNEIWSAFVRDISFVVQRRGEVPPLLQSALSVLGARPWLPPLLAAPDAATAAAAALLPPTGCILPHELPGELVSLLLALERDSAALEVPPQDESSPPSRVVLRVPNLQFLASLEPEQCSRCLGLLGVAAQLDGDHLLAVVQAFSRHPPQADNEAMQAYGAALTQVVEASQHLSAADWRTLRNLKFVPTLVSSPPSSDAEAPPPSELAMASLAAPVQCTLFEHYSVCPVGFKLPVHPQLVAQQENEHRGLHRCSKQFGWDVPPPLAAVVAYLEWCAACPDRELVRATAGNASVRKTYAYIEKRLVRGDVTEPEDQAALASISTLYFPEQEIAIPVRKLSRDPQAQRVEPYLSFVDRSMLASFPTLIDHLGIPERHSETQLLATLTEIAQKEGRSVSKPAASGRGQQASASLRLSDTGRALYAACLEYLVSITSSAAAAESAKGGGEPPIPSFARTLLVPTSDGGLAPAATVAYDFFNVSDSSGTADILHSCVTATVARALGMAHTGKRYLRDRSSKYSGAFKAKGQRQSLTNAIKRILGDYSDAQSVLMEMLQNADDAGAADVHFFLDLREFPKEEEGLLGAGMRRCQGPALVVTNDKCFTRSDFDALMEIGCGHKKSDKMSIGRFGVGFNSVYHMTDCPSIVSGGTTVFLDPSASHLSFASPEAPGLMIEHTTEPQLLQHFPGQFAPYRFFGVKFDRDFSGTVFRLPLRAEPQAESLSERQWSPNNVRQLFDDFAQQMPTLLLFLKNVVSISLSEINPAGERVPMRRVRIANRDDVDEFRLNLLSFVAVQHPEKPPAPPHNESCLFDVQMIARGKTATHRQWLVATSVHSPQGAPDVGAPKDLRKKLLPWASVAIPMMPEADGQFPEALKPSEALLHCFLPMPVRTGLPFHLHGSFALSSDRRGMWTDSLGSSESWEVQWNKFILETVAPIAIAQVVCHGWPIVNAAAQSAYFAVWPTPKVGVSEIHALVGNAFFDRLAQDESLEPLWCAAQSCYVSYERACFTIIGAGGTAAKQSGSGGGGGGGGAMKSLSTEVAQIILDDEKLVCVPQTVFDAFVQASERLCVARPDDLVPAKVCRVLAARAAASTTSTIPFNAVFPSLRGCEEHSAPFMAEISSFCTASDELSIEGVPLLLLRSGDLGIVRKEKHLFVMPTDARDLELIVPTLSECVLHDDFFRQFSRARGAAFAEVQERCGIARVTIENFSMLLGTYATKMVPLDAVGNRLHWDGRPASPLGRWLLAVWHFLNARAAKIDDELLEKCGTLGGYPLIPARRGPERVLVPLRDAKLVVSGTADNEVQEALLLLGIWTVDGSFPEIRRVRALCNIADVEGQNVGELMANAHKTGRFETLTNEQRPQLLNWLLRVNDNHKGIGARLGGWLGRSSAGTGPLISTIRELPLFERYNAPAQKWVWEPLDANAAAMPPDIPLSSLCDGFFRKANPDVHLPEMTRSQFYLTRVIPALGADDCVMPIAEFVNHLRTLGRDQALLTGCSGALKMMKFIPSERASVPAAELLRRQRERGLPLTLKRALIARISESDIPLDSRMFLQHPHLASAVRDLHLERLDMRARHFPAECVRPMLCPDAPMPNCVAMLLDGAGDSAKHMVPSFMWDDWQIRNVLVEVGVTERVPCEVLVEAAHVLPRVKHGRTLARDFYKYHSLTKQSAPAVRTFMHNLGVSLSQVAQMTADKETIAKLAEVEFLLPCPTVERGLPLSLASAPGDLTFYKPSAMCPFEQRFLCWTKRPVMSPLVVVFDDLVKVPVNDVVAHLCLLCIKQAELPPSLVDQSLHDVFRYLVTGPMVSEAAQYPPLGETRCLALPREPGAPAREVTMLSRVIFVPSLGSMRPFFFQPHDFEDDVRTLIRVLKAPGTPASKTVLDVLPEAAAWCHSKAAAAKMKLHERLEIYVEILRLLLTAADSERVSITDPEWENRPLVLSLQVPLANGTMVANPQATTPDAPALLRRIRPNTLKIVHPLMTYDLCVGLGVPRMSSCVVETPLRVEQPKVQPAFQRTLSMFFRTPMFIRAMLRLLASEASTSGSVSGGARKPRKQRGDEAKGGLSLGFDLSKRQRERLASLNLSVVHSIMVRIIDTRAPSVDISAATSSPLSSCDFETNTILLAASPEGPSAGHASADSRVHVDGFAFAIDPHYLIAAEIAKVLGSRSLQNLAPLCAVLQAAMRGPGHFGRINGLLDQLGCVDVCSANGRPLVGSLVDHDELVAFAKCPLPRSCALLPSAIPPLVGRLDNKDAGLVRWARPEAPLLPASACGYLVLLPLCMSGAQR